ncbi:MAG: hypothetical protein HY757_05730 [Nitrospirae bacterium]|nr:hypothetical protein [Nitrospirota bacterium]
MPISNCPLTLCSNGIYRPILPICIINPHTSKQLKTYGLIDTGADECAVPASMADLLGHNLQSGQSKIISTGNGETIAFSHTTSFEVYHPSTNKLLYTLADTPIDFMPNLPVVLLGVNNFLNKFILNIDYPKKTFSIKIS